MYTPANNLIRAHLYQNLASTTSFNRTICGIQKRFLITSYPHKQATWLFSSEKGIKNVEKCLVVLEG